MFINLAAFAAGALVFLGRLLAYPRMKNIHAREGYFQRTRLYVQGTVVYGIILSMLQPEVWRSLQKRNDQNREAREEYIRRRQEAREKEELTSKAPVS